MKADTITKDYVRDADIFADIFNYFIYGGRQVILSEHLTDRDSTKIALPYGVDGAVVPIQKFRDVQKLYAVMTDGKIEYVLYGAENQSDIHYAMAVKNNLYDALEYAGQVEEAARAHRRERKRRKEHGEMSGGKDEDRKALSSGEFLSGFWKDDRLIPSVTVTVFFGSEEWDGPLSLSDMMDVTDQEVLACMNDYRVHLIAPAQMADEEIMKFQSSLREVMFFIKYSKDKEKLSGILKTNEKRFREVERRAVDVIEVITNSGMKYDESEEVVDVCQAIQEMKREERLIGEQKGEQIGALKKAQEAAANFYKLGVDVDKIAQGVGYAVETVKQWLGLSDDKG